MKKAIFPLLLFIVVCIGLGLHAVRQSPIEKSHKDTTIFSPMQITSSAFSNQKEIPTLYSCDGKGINPPLSFVDIPKEAKSLALIVDDPDAPMGTFVHWVAYNIPPNISAVEEGAGIPAATVGKNSAGQENFVGPCPPNGEHRYFFKLYALDSAAPIPSGASKEALLDAMQGHILSEAELVGVYKRQ